MSALVDRLEVERAAAAESARIFGLAAAMAKGDPNGRLYARAAAAAARRARELARLIRQIRRSEKRLRRATGPTDG